MEGDARSGARSASAAFPPRMSMCSVCLGKPATKYCKQCNSVTCNNCATRMHQHPKRKNHELMLIPGKPAFLLDSDPELTSLTPQDREWPEQGIRVSQDKHKALEDCRKLSECFNKSKSLRSPSRPENGPESSGNSTSSKATHSRTPFCQGLLLDKRLSPGENKHDGKLKYLKDEEWKELKKLGEGSSGEVSKAQDQETKFICAVKQIPFENYEPFEGLAWAHMDHQNIPKLYGIVREVHEDAANISDAGKVFLFCEEIKNHKPFRIFIEEECRKWKSFLVKEFIDNVEKQVDSAVAHIHSKGLAHKDLENIVIEDFGVDKGRDRKAWVLDFGRTAPAKEYRASRNAPAIEYDKNHDKLFIKELFGIARKVLKEIEDAEEVKKRSKEEDEKELSEQIAAGMKNVEIKGDAGAASSLLPTVEPPNSKWSEPPMDGGGETVKDSRFTWVKIDGTSSAASVSSSPSTSKPDDLSEDDTQDQFTIAAVNKNLVKNPSNQIPSNENVPREDPKHQPVSEIQSSRVEHQ